MERPLLWSLTDLEPVVSDLIRAVAPNSILEIGTGDYSRQLLNLAMQLGSKITSIDVYPAFEHNGTVKGRSLDVFDLWQEENMSFDLAVIDGDHNYYTVTRELQGVYSFNPNAVCILHDVGWPWGRRDMYYDPASIPVAHRHDHSWDLGVVPGERELKPWGFRGMGKFAVACHEGDPKNGVLTAVEDFAMAAESPARRFAIGHLPSVFGLAVLYPERPGLRNLTHILESFDRFEPLLDRLEKNRVELYSELLRRDYAR